MFGMFRETFICVCYIMTGKMHNYTKEDEGLFQLFLENFSGFQKDYSSKKKRKR